MRKIQEILMIFVTGTLLGLGISWGISLLLVMGIVAALILFLIFLLKIDVGFYVVLAFLLVPVTVALGFASPYSVGKTADIPLYELLIPIFFVFLVIRKSIGREKVLQSSPLNVPLLLWFSLIFITYFRNPIFLSDLFGSRRTGQLYHILYFCMLDVCIYLSAVGVLKQKKQILKVTKVMFVIFVGIVGVSIIRCFTGLEIPGLMDPDWKVDWSAWSNTQVARIDVLGRYSALGMLSFLCFRSFSLSRRIRLPIILLFIFGVILSGRRASLIFMVFTSFLFCLLKRKIKWGLGITLGLLFFLFILPHMPPSIRYLRIFNFLAGTAPGGYSIQDRLIMWRMALDIIRINPIFGIGYGTYWRYSPFSFTGINMLVASGSTHNAYLSALVNYGVIGLVSFLWLHVISLKTAWSLYKNHADKFIRELMLWVTLYLTGTLINFLVEGSPYSVFHFFIFGILSAVYALYNKQIQKRDTENEEDINGRTWCMG